MWQIYKYYFSPKSPLVASRPGMLKKYFLTAKYAKKALSTQSQNIIIQLFATFAVDGFQLFQKPLILLYK
jgi:hypothetical protein